METELIKNRVKFQLSGYGGARAASQDSDLDTEKEAKKLERALQRPSVSIMSPLRYPGSKRRLANYIRRLIELNNIEPDLFVEPFAGGASVALQLLNDGVVKSIGLADLDPLISAFWEVVFFDTEWLVNQVRDLDVTIEKWHEFKCSQPRCRRARAIACLFLNRTSFSGILAPGAGPIGGFDQASEYKIDCRFPKQTIIKRIQEAAKLADRVKFVWNRRWKETITGTQNLQRDGHVGGSVFYYFDPPFFEKAERLYAHYFVDADHECFRKAVTTLKASWALSYDVSEKFKMLYSDSGAEGANVEVLYSTARTAGNRQAKEAIVTNLERLPAETRLWRKSEEWSGSGSA